MSMIRLIGTLMYVKLVWQPFQVGGSKFKFSFVISIFVQLSFNKEGWWSFSSCAPLGRCCTCSSSNQMVVSQGRCKCSLGKCLCSLGVPKGAICAPYGNGCVPWQNKLCSQRGMVICPWNVCVRQIIVKGNGCMCPNKWSSFKF